MEGQILSNRAINWHMWVQAKLVSLSQAFKWPVPHARSDFKAEKLLYWTCESAGTCESKQAHSGKKIMKQGRGYTLNGMRSKTYIWGTFPTSILCTKHKNLNVCTKHTSFQLFFLRVRWVNESKKLDSFEHYYQVHYLPALLKNLFQFLLIFAHDQIKSYWVPRHSYCLSITWVLAG